MVNIAVDLGNSRIKVGFFESSTWVKTVLANSLEELQSIISIPHDNLIVSSVKGDVSSTLNNATTRNSKIVLNHKTSLPIIIKYSTPSTLGVDRIADACGALQLFPNSNSLVIDLGTCINYEFLDQDNNYWGGIISPGVAMRFKAMNTFTAQLPLVEAQGEPKLIGDSTANCLQSGVMNGILEEINGFISRMKENYPILRVIMTGGDAHFFENQLKHSIFAAPELALVGLNRILMYNVAN